MKFIFITLDGIGLPIAYKLQEEGNEVLVGQVSDYKKCNVKIDEDKETKKRRMSLYDGMLKKEDADVLVNKLLKIKNKKDYFVFCDFNWLYPYADKLSRAGFKGLFPSKKDCSMEKDREKAKELVEELYDNVELGETYEFSKVNDAIKFLAENVDTAYVLKGNNEEAKTVVPRTNDPVYNHMRLIDALQKYEKEYNKNGFILEEKILDSIEFTPQAISFNGTIVGVNIDLEVKGLGGADTGELTGCSMDMVIHQDVNSKVYEIFLKPIEHLMIRPDEMVIWDASIYYSPSKDKFYFGEYCFNRPGYNAFMTELATHPDVTSYFNKLVNEQELLDKTVKPYGSSFRIFNLVNDPDYAKMHKKDLLINCKPGDKNVWTWDIHKDENDKFRTSGLDENMACVTGGGQTPEQACEKAFKRIQKNDFQDDYSRSLSDYKDTTYQTSIMRRLDILSKKGII